MPDMGERQDARKAGEVSAYRRCRFIPPARHAIRFTAGAGFFKITLHHISAEKEGAASTEPIQINPNSSNAR